MKKLLCLCLTLCLLSMPFASGAVTPQWGDVNGDGVIDAKDALGILKYGVGKATATDTDAFMQIADVNGDGEVDAKDALHVLQVAVGTRLHFDVQKETLPYAWNQGSASTFESEYLTDVVLCNSKAELDLYIAGGYMRLAPGTYALFEQYTDAFFEANCLLFFQPMSSGQGDIQVTVTDLYAVENEIYLAVQIHRSTGGGYSQAVVQNLYMLTFAKPKNAIDSVHGVATYRVYDDKDGDHLLLSKETKHYDFPQYSTTQPRQVAYQVAQTFGASQNLSTATVTDVFVLTNPAQVDAFAKSLLYKAEDLDLSKYNSDYFVNNRLLVFRPMGSGGLDVAVTVTDCVLAGNELTVDITVEKKVGIAIATAVYNEYWLVELQTTTPDNLQVTVNATLNVVDYANEDNPVTVSHATTPMVFDPNFMNHRVPVGYNMGWPASAAGTYNDFDLIEDVALCNSREEFVAYITDSGKAVGYDQNAYAYYDDAFFENKSLLLFHPVGHYRGGYGVEVTACNLVGYNMEFDITVTYYMGGIATDTIENDVYIVELDRPTEQVRSVIPDVTINTVYEN